MATWQHGDLASDGHLPMALRHNPEVTFPSSCEREMDGPADSFEAESTATCGNITEGESVTP